MTDFYIKEDDSAPSVTAQLTHADGSAVDLTNADVEFSMMRPRGAGVVFTSAASIQDASTGEVRYDWNDGDTTEPGRYRCEFIVTYSDGRQERFPNYGYHTVVILPNTEA